MKKRIGWLRAGGLGALGAWIACVALLNTCCLGPVRVEPLVRATPVPAVDDSLELARAYAPWILHEVHATRGRQDLLAAVDFDGNMDGDDNWETMPLHELVPVVLYAHVETATHHFLTYHLFHPRDWEVLDLGVHMTHEGDGENLQVVVEKAGGRVVLLYAQAHYRGRLYATSGSGISSGTVRVAGEPLLVDESGRPDPDGRHAVVFVESKGHGIYGALDRDARARVEADGGIVFERQGIVLRPARQGETAAEPVLDESELDASRRAESRPDAFATVPYLLESTVAKLWPLLARGEISGPGRLLDGDWPYSSPRVTVAVPRYHRGNRFSGPLGSSRGISPFAVDVGWSKGTLGALLFDPAERYAGLLSVPGTWSREYVGYPFVRR